MIRKAIAVTMPNGTSYASISQACIAEGIPYKVAKRRADKLNISLPEAIDALKRNGWKARSKQIEVVGPDGTQYASIKDGCKAENVSYTAVLRKLYAGMTFPQAVQDIRAANAKREVRVNGKTYACAEQACKAYGIRRQRITYFTRRGLTAEYAFERILKEDVQKHHPKPITDHKGRKFKSVREFAKMYGFNSSCAMLKGTAGGKMSLGDILECIERRVNAGRSLIVAGFRIIRRISGAYFKTIDPNGHESVMHIDELYDRHFAEIGFDGKGDA